MIQEWVYSNFTGRQQVSRIRSDARIIKRTLLKPEIKKEDSTTTTKCYPQRYSPHERTVNHIVTDHSDTFNSSKLTPISSSINDRIRALTEGLYALPL